MHPCLQSSLGLPLGTRPRSLTAPQSASTSAPVLSRTRLCRLTSCPRTPCSLPPDTLPRLVNSPEPQGTAPHLQSAQRSASTISHPTSRTQPCTLKTHLRTQRSAGTLPRPAHNSQPRQGTALRSLTVQRPAPTCAPQPARTLPSRQTSCLRSSRPREAQGTRPLPERSPEPQDTVPQHPWARRPASNCACPPSRKQLCMLRSFPRTQRLQDTLPRPAGSPPRCVGLLGTQHRSRTARPSAPTSVSALSRTQLCSQVGILEMALAGR
jgi:hypothetical protein